MNTVIQKSNNITLSSVAMYGSWLYHKPTRLLFDCGEGCGNTLRSRMFGIESCLISHFDSDHCLGLLSLIGLRAKTKGDREKDLSIYVPAGDPRWTAMRDYVNACWKKLPYRLRWFPIEPGFELQLGGTHLVKAFAMQHRRTMTLGYKVIEIRSRLKPEYKGQDIRALLASGVDKDTINEVYHQNTFAWCLDHYKLDEDAIKGCDLAILDSTFLRVEDRQELSHASLEEGIALCQRVGIKRAVFAHISTRYGIAYQQDVNNKLKELDFSAQLCFTDGLLEL